MKRQPQSDLSIVICALNGLEYTKLLVDSIRKHSRFEHEIVLYSDGSTDGTLEWLRAQQDIRWEHDATNRGICTAMNRAALLATRGYLYFPNTDHVLSPGWDAALLGRLKYRTVVSSQCIEPGVVPVASIFHAKDCGTRWDRFNEERFLAAARELSRSEATPGINYPFAISRKLWEEVGGLDERFDPGPANDPDLFYRLHLAGARMIRAEDSVIYHFSGKSSRLAGEAKSEHREWHLVTVRNEKRFEEKWGERYRYKNGGLPDPGPEARKRFTPRVEVSSRLKVAIDATSVDEKRQGIGKYALNLIRALDQLEDGPVIRCLSPNPEFLEKELGITNRVTCHTALTAELGAQVFHGPAFSLSPGIGLPSVATIHDLIFLHHPDWYPDEFVRHLTKVVEESVATARHIIAVSEHTRREILKRFRVDPCRVTRIHEALPEETCAEPPEELRRRVRDEYARGREFVLSVGVQQPRKNAVGLVRAFADLRDPDLGLVLVGGEQCEDPRLKEEIEAASLVDRVILTPRVSEEELSSLYKEAKLFVHPSFDEGFGLTLLEAMAAGTPVISSNAGALEEVAGDAAILVSPDDTGSFTQSMKQVLADADLRGDLVRKGRERLKEFSWDRTAKETLSVFSQTLKSAPSVSVRSRFRIAVDARMLGHDRIGTGRYTREIVGGLLQHAPEAEFVLIGPDKLTTDWMPVGTSVMQHIPAGTETLLDPVWEQFSLPSHLLGCDLYFSPTGIAPVTSPCPAVPVIHDLGFEENPHHFDERLRVYLSKWVRNSCLRADRILTVSEFTRRRVIETYGISPDRVQTVHHGRENREVSDLPKAPRPLVLCVSSFEPNKNLPLLVEAFGTLAWSGDLVLAGRAGRDLDRVRKAIGKEKRVRLLLDPEDSEISALYRDASLFVFPSLYEGFGLPLLEAMTAGLPVIANRVASCPEVVGEAGILLDEPSADALAKAMRSVLSDQDLEKELRAKSLARAGEFSWSNAAAETWRIFERCLEEA